MPAKFYWHIHHDELLEVATEPITKRREFIKANKPEHEIETRLRLLKPVKGELPAEVIKARDAHDKARDAYVKARDAYVKARDAYDKARDACDKARDACDKAWDARDKARDACDKALKKHKKEIEALHAKECPNCPWNGETIFPEKK